MRLATTYKTFTKISVSWLFGVHRRLLRHSQRQQHRAYTCGPSSPVRLAVIEILPERHQPTSQRTIQSFLAATTTTSHFSFPFSSLYPRRCRRRHLLFHSPSAASGKVTQVELLVCVIIIKALPLEECCSQPHNAAVTLGGSSEKELDGTFSLYFFRFEETPILINPALFLSCEWRA